MANRKSENWPDESTMSGLLCAVCWALMQRNSRIGERGKVHFENGLTYDPMEFHGTLTSLTSLYVYTKKSASLSPVNFRVPFLPLHNCKSFKTGEVQINQYPTVMAMSAR